MAEVDVSIFSNPEDISWRILRIDDDDSSSQVFGYRAGSYDATGIFSQLVILTSGSFEIQLTRNSLAADALSSLGIINFTTGLTEIIEVLDFIGKEGNTTVASSFVLP
jgi:hypothetical protein